MSPADAFVVWGMLAASTLPLAVGLRALRWVVARLWDAIVRLVAS